MKSKTIGILLLAGAAGVLIPYTILTMTFDYPDILRKDTATILTKFHEGGSPLIITWFAFALGGLFLLPAYQLIGKKLTDSSGWVKVATNIGIISLVVQMIGLLRWVFVVPVLADTYIQATDEATKAAAIVSFKSVHQFGGVLLGEHIGQLFTIVWTLFMCVFLVRQKFIAKWIGWFGIVSAVIYLLAQAELLHTVIPNFPMWEMAGFIGSTLWLVWLVIVGIVFVRKRG